MTNALHVIINMFEVSIDEASFASTCQPILWVKWVSILINNFYNPIPLHYCCFKLITKIHQFEANNKSCFALINDMIMACSHFHCLAFLDCVSKDYKCCFFFFIDEFFFFFCFPLTLNLKSKCINSCTCIDLALWFWQISRIDQIIAIKDSLQLRVLGLWAMSSFCYVIPTSIAMQNVKC